ncbi:MAG TPA: hypothetical protein VH164_03985 [Ktedonobacteraceae bacterium]|jgi:hypothetical protein|nr:hypothetical protein [Ktedonobacteraceae bacterium]
MSNDPQLDAIVECLKSGQQSAPGSKPRRKRPAKVRPTAQEIVQRTQLAPDAPAPLLNGVIAEHGEEPTARALEAWNARLDGVAIVDIAHQLGVSIELAKVLLREVHAAIYEDLKANVDLNRQLDLGRIDQIILGHLPGAKAGDDKSANVVLRALQQRAQLTGQIAPSEPGRGPGPNNVLVWIQNQLPSINRIVDSLPLE